VPRKLRRRRRPELRKLLRKRVRKRGNSGRKGSAVANGFGTVASGLEALTKNFRAVALPTGRFADRYKISLIDRYKTIPKEKGQAILLGLVLCTGLVLSLLLAAAAPTRVFSEDVPVIEVRGLWVLRNTLVSRKEIDRMLRQAKDAGFNVLFAQVRGRGDAFYNSSIEPRAEMLADDGFDPLSYLVAEAHRRGFEVHLWLNALLVWSAPWKPTDTDHVVLSHPDWVAVRSDGRSLSELSRDEIEAMGIEGVFLAPGNPEVREHIRAVVKELVQHYDIDGIHLDYIRYPDLSVGYDKGTKTEFMRRYGVDPSQIANDGEAMIGLFGERGLRDLGMLWENWRVSSVDALVDSVRSDLKAVNPRVRLSAAVIADSRLAICRHAQDWPSWLERGILDFAVPMCYSASTRFVQDQVRAIKSLVGENRFYPGIAMYNQSPGRVVEKVRVLRKMGIDGFSMFCYDPEHPRGYVLRELSRTVFANPARPWADEDRLEPRR
jgi:uncharacterized lipoprotein YddW (UPF0748 family)